MADPIIKKFNVFDGKVTSEVPKLKPGSYRLNFTFKDAESSETNHYTSTYDLTVKPRTSSMEFIPNYPENDDNPTECIVPSNGKKGFKVKLSCDNVGIESDKLDGTLEFYVISESTEVLMGSIPITDYTDNITNYHEIKEGYLQTKWSQVVKTLGRSHSYGRYYTRATFKGADGFSDITIKPGLLHHTTQAKLINNKSIYNVSQTDKNFNDYMFSICILDDLNQPLKGVKGKWFIREKDVNASYISFSDTLYSDSDGYFTYYHNIEDAVNNGLVSIGDSYDLQFKVDSVPYLGSKPVVKNATLNILQNEVIPIRNLIIESTNTIAPNIPLTVTISSDDELESTSLPDDTYLKIYDLSNGNALYSKQLTDFEDPISIDYTEIQNAFQEAFEHGGVRVRIQINGQYVYAEPIAVDLINPLP